MKNTPTIIVLLAMFAFPGLGLFGEEDEFLELDITTKLPIKKLNDSWIQITVPFKFLKHPRLEALNGSRPTTISQAFNPKFINDIKVKLWICFPNKYKQNLLGSNASLKETDFYQYYSAEVEYRTLEFERSTKNANFLFPTPIAERDGFLEASIKPVGYVIEISHKGSNFDISNSVYFNYRGATPQVLESFRTQAVSKSSENKGVLLPAHEISMNYLDGMGPVKTRD